MIEQAAQSPLSAWETFYVIVGSSGAALTGLQFVVIALVANSPRQSTSHEVDAFGTPTVVHFCAVLLVAAILSAPWRGLGGVRLSLAACGIGGLGYCLVVVRRARNQKRYSPVFEDWLWYAVLPLVAYTFLLLASIVLRIDPERVLFLIGIVALLLLFTGIHNAWDTVTYIAVAQLVPPGKTEANGEAAPKAVEVERTET
jgi:hypothetical protein